MKNTIIFSLVLVAALVASMTVFCSIRQTDALFKSNLEALTSDEVITPDEYHRGGDGKNWKTYTVLCIASASSTQNSGGSYNNNSGVNVNTPIPNTPVSAGVDNSSGYSYSNSSSSTINYDKVGWLKDVCGKGFGLCFSSAPEGHPCA